MIICSITMGFLSCLAVVELELNGLVYAHGAGYNTTKQCLAGTRADILAEIEDWARSTDPDVPRVFWLNGAAGTGKSAIAHTIALKFDQSRELGSCLCFDRTYLTERRHEKVFSTIARDLASHNPGIKRELADAIRDRSWLKSTPDIIQQWENLLVKPAARLSNGGTILLVIEALDESGDAHSRGHLLSILARRARELPSNFRILLTSRTLDDISQALGSSRHVISKVTDDIPKSSTDQDISIYISRRLAQVNGFFLDNSKLHLLVDRSEGLFQWAFVACEFIQGSGKFSSPETRFVKLTNSPTTRSVTTLDTLYDTLLQEMCADNDEDDMQVFRSVMGQILSLYEPLSLSALKTIRKHCPSGLIDADDISSVVKHMGSLLSGITNDSVPIRPLHSSFHDYLTDRSRSKAFYIDTSLHRNDLAFSTLQVMKAELRFNICGLESSYLLNSDVPDLAERIKRSISSAVSYSCRYWTAHVEATVFDSEIANQVKEFFNRQFLFWIEVLSLIKSVQIAAPTLSSIMKWITV
ncbi:hypothetical protein BDZ97DRAFT_1711901, partial [Flammula alnicola]